MFDHLIRRGGRLLRVVLLLAALPALGQQDVRFAVHTFQIEGNQLIDTARIEAAVQAFTGPEQTFDTLRRAVEAVEALYADAGYGAVRVQLPEQDIKDGIVRLKVIEARLGRIRVEGNQHFSDANIRASVPALVEGEPPRLDQAGASLALANDSFAKRTRLTLQRGETPGSVDAQLRVADIRPWRIAASLDNTGDDSTGNERLGLAYQHANLFDLDHAFSAQYITSPLQTERVAIYGLGYKIPLYALGDSIEAAYGNSNVDSGNVSTAAGNYGISGRGEFATLRYNLGLPRFAGNEQRLAIAQDWRYYESKVAPEGDNVSLIPDLSAAPTSLTYTLSSPIVEQAFQWKASLGYFINQSSGQYGSTAAYNEPGARPGADARFQLWRWNLSATTPLPAGFSLRADLNGQETQDLLISGEQFGIGGMDSVRGYGEREILNDRGYRGTLELSSPAVNLPLSDIDLRTTFVAFHDFGAVYRNEPLPGELHDEHAASVGFGMRLAAGQNTYLRADVARALRSAGTTQDGDYKGHVQVMVLF